MAATATLSSKHQIAAPKAIRDDLHWKAGQEFVFIPKGKGVLLMPVPEPEQLAASAKEMPHRFYGGYRRRWKMNGILAWGKSGLIKLLIGLLAIPLSNQKTVAKWLVIAIRTGCPKTSARSLVMFRFVRNCVSPVDAKHSAQSGAPGRAMSGFAKAVILLLSLTGLGTWGGNAYALACTSAATGNWSSAATWAAPCNVAGGPVAADTVTIAAAHTVTVDVNSAATSITIAAPSVAAHGVNINPGITLNVSGAISMTAPGTNLRTSTLAVGSGTLTAASIAINGGTGTKVSQVTVSTGTITTTGNITFAGTAANARIVSTGASMVNVGGNFASGGTLTTGGTGTINFNGGAAQTIGAYATYNNITINKAAGGVALAGNATIGGALSVNTGTLTVGAFSLAVTGATTVNSTISITSTTGAKTFTGDVTINNGGTLSETVAEPITYGGNVTINNGGTLTEFGAATMACAGNLQNDGTYTASTGVHTFSGAAMTFSGANAIVIPSVAVTGTYTNSGTLTVATALTGAGTLTNGDGTAGTLNIGGTSTITTLTATAAGNIVNYTGAGQTVKATTYHHLGLGGSGAKAMGATTINGDFSMSGTATTAPTGALAVGGNFSIGATNTFTAGALAHSVGGNWSNSGTFTAGTSTVTFNGTAAQTIGGAATTSFNNLTIANTGAGSTTLGINTSVAGNLSVNTGTLDLATFTLNRTAAGGTLAVSNGATLNIGGTNGFPANYTTHTLGTTSTVEYSGTNQSVGAEMAPGYGNLTIRGSGSKTAAGDVTVGGTLTLTAGTFTVGANTLTLNGPTIAGTPANLSTTAASSLSFGGSATGINVPSSVALLNNLTVNNSNGITLNSSPALSGVLTLTSGAVTTGANILGTSASCPASIVRAGGFVNGNLRLTFPTGTTTCTYHVGSGTNYAPIGVTMVTTLLGGGTLTGSTTGNEHPQVASSGIDSSLDVNRYWTLWSSGDTVSASSYGATFNFVAGDKDALATPTSFIVGKYASSAWTLPAPVTAGATSTGVSSIAGPINSVTDFVAGEAVFVCSVPSGLTAGMTCECDNFNRASVNPSTIFGGNYTLTQSSGTPGWPQIANLGLLQMTNNSGNMATSATVPGTFPAAGNLVSVEFRHYAYKTGGAAGADGIAVTLSDSGITPLAGAFGGSLGYAQKTIAGGAPVDVNGFAGGWVGIAIDEWGNFSAATEGRVGGPAQTAESVAVRGSGAGLTGYPYLAGTTTLSPTLDNTSSATPARGDAYRVQVDARCYQNNTANLPLPAPNDCATINPTATKYAQVTVYRDTTGAGTFNVGNQIVNFEAYATATSVGATQANVPATWKLSYTGSTGGSTNFHELGALKVCGQTFVPPAGYRIQVDNLTPSTCGTPGGSPSSPIVTVTALDTNGNPVTTYNKTVTLSAPLSGGGASSATWSLKSGNGTFSGGNQYTFVAADLGVAQFYLTDASPQSVTITVSENGGTLSSSLAPPPIVYSGGSFTIANIDALAADTGGGVVAGRTHLMSITRSNGCVTDTTYTGAKNLDGWYTPATGDHPVGALAPQLCATNGSGTCLPTTGACQTLSIAPPSVDPLSNNMPTLTFGTTAPGSPPNGVAYFCLATSDVGKYSVSLRDDSATPVIGSSGTLTARPFAVVVSNVKQGATNNPAATGPGGSIFAIAGTNFEAAVGGYLWSSTGTSTTGNGDSNSDGVPDAVALLNQVITGGIASHYADTVTLAAGAPFAPAVGMLSGGSVTVTGGSGTTTALSYDEVGSFTLTAVPATSYLSSGVNLGNRVAIFSNPASASPTGWVGRFIPDHFALSAMSITNRILSGCAPASTFTYAGEGLQAVFTLEAQNASGSPTANYLTANGYAKLDGTVPANFYFGAIDLADIVPPLTATPSMGLTLGTSSGSWTTAGKGTFNVNLMVNRAATPDGPYESFNLGMDPIDTDGVKLGSYNLDVNNDTTNDHGLVGASKIRFGRLKLSNAHGSELLNLPVPIQAQYWNGNTFVTNGDDSCTQVSAANIGLANYTKNLAAGETVVSTGAAFIAGVSSLTLSKPGATNNGSVDLVVNLGAAATEAPCITLNPDPVTGGANLGYLQGKWCGGAYDKDPTARATFGVYKGNKEFIYLRENY